MWISKVAETLNVGTFSFFFFFFFVMDDFENGKKWMMGCPENFNQVGCCEEKMLQNLFLSFFFITIGGGVNSSGQHLLEIE